MSDYCPTTGKRRFRSKEAVRRCMGHLSASLRFYLCPYCKSYHLTKEPHFEDARTLGRWDRQKKRSSRKRSRSKKARYKNKRKEKKSE